VFQQQFFRRDQDRDFDRDRDFGRPGQPGFGRRSPLDILRFFLPVDQPSFPQYPQYGPPPGPPPTFIPQQPVGVFAVDPGAISSCLFRFTFIWPHRQRGFWFYPIFVGPRSIAGFRWTGFNWLYFGMDLRDIQSFACI